MALMDWSDKLDVGVDNMNHQHKKILSLMNNLYEAFEQKKEFDQFISILDELKDFTIKHFAEEEAYMESINFEGIQVHTGIHQQLLEKFTSNYQTITNERKLTQEFFDFLKFWLSSHIQGIDIKYGKAIRQGIGK
jgi:hemerythrin-like metal-binding protein